MIRHRIHSGSKIFFPDPYVVRVEYPIPGDYSEDMRNFQKLARTTYKLIKGTWGYCMPEEEQVDGFSKLDKHGQLSFAFNEHYRQMLRGYFAFKEEMDALQFRLSISVTSVRVNMWPHRKFTIHEYTEEVEDDWEETDE